MFEKSALKRWFTDADDLRARLNRADDKRALEAEILAMYRRWESLSQRLTEGQPLGTSIPTGRETFSDPKTRMKNFGEMMDLLRLCKSGNLPDRVAEMVILLIKSFPKPAPSSAEGDDLGLEMLDEPRNDEDDDEDEYQPPTS